MTNASKFRNENAWWCVKISVVFSPDLSVSLSSCCCRCCFWPRRQGGAKGSKKKAKKKSERQEKTRLKRLSVVRCQAKVNLFLFLYVFFFLANSRFWWKRRWRGMDVGGWVDPSCRFIMKLLLFGWSCGEAAVHAA